MQQEWVDRNFLASSHVCSPDPRLDHPPEGQRLLIAWDFPHSLFQRELTLTAEVRFWKGPEQIISFPLERKRGTKALFFPNDSILTYRVQVLSKDGSIVDTWKHHFFTKLITVGDSGTAPWQEPASK